MGKRRLYDEDVHAVFGLWGVQVAIYFEAIRFKQQLTPNQFFAFGRDKIQERTDLTPKQQARARNILLTCNWIETKRGFKKGGGTITLFRMTSIAVESTKNTTRVRYIPNLLRSLR